MKDHMDYMLDAIIEIIENFENPYPPDVYTWDNPEPCGITRGRLNRFAYEIVENTKREIIKAIREELGVIP